PTRHSLTPGARSRARPRAAGAWCAPRAGRPRARRTGSARPSDRSRARGGWRSRSARSPPRRAGRAAPRRPPRAPARPPAAPPRVRLQRVVGRLVLPRADAAREVVTPVVDEGVHHLARLARRQGAHADVRDAERGAVGGLARLVEARDPVGVDARVDRVLVDEPGDRVMGDDATEVYLGRADELAVDFAAVAQRGDVARRRLEAADELRLEPAAAEV